MLTQAGFDPNLFGAFANPFQAYFNNLDALSQGLGPVKGLARWQLEMAGFMSRRAQALMEFPSRMSQCRTPQDFSNEQMRFWREALEQCSESSHRMAEAWGQMLMPFAAGGEGQRRSRDYISFPEAEGTGGQQSVRGGRERRAA